MDILKKINIQNKILKAPEFGEETGGGGASSTPSNAVFIGGVEVDKFYLGNSDDVKIFLGDVKLYPRDITYKLVAQYSDTTEYKVECNSSTSLTQTEVTSHTTPVSSMTSAVVSDCVNRIDTNAFSGASSLTSITIDDGVRQFGNQAFIHTEALREMSFPSSLNTIEGACFRFSGIRKFNNNIPSGVTYLGSGSFADMYSLSAITVPSSVTGSSNNLFLRDSGLTQVHFEGRTAPALGADAFKNCTSLIKIVIPDCDCYNSYAAQSQFSGKTNIIYGENGAKCKKESYPYAFRRVSRGGSAYTVACNSTSSNTISSANTRSGLSNAQISGSTQTQTPVSVVFGDCCNTINGKACSGWTYLTSVTISDKVTTLNGDSIFSNTPRLSHLEIGRGITKIIQSRTFYYTGLSASTKSDLNLAANVGLAIGSNAFYHSAWDNITLPRNCTIASNPFSEVTASTLSFGSGTVIGNGNVSSSAFNNARILSINLNGVAQIGDFAFYKVTGLASITIPSSVTNFANNSFVGCNNLTSVTINYASNATLGGYQFQGVPIRSLTIGNKPTSIGKDMFYNCTSLTSIEIPSNISSIGASAFNGCSGLTSITVNRTTPPTLNGTEVFNDTNNCPIYVPAASINAYKTADNWSAHASRIQAIPT